MTELDFQNHTLCQETRRLVTEEFDRKRREGKISRVHDTDHVVAVSNFAGVTARAISRGKNQEGHACGNAVLDAIAGNLHDYHREAKETEPHGPTSAQFFRTLRTEDVLGSRESQAVFDAIYNHEMSIPELSKRFGDVMGDYDTSLPAVIAFSLKTGDGILEASGYRVLERRAFFTASERLKHGDLKDGFKFPDDASRVVLGETLRRLYDKLPIDSYPEWIKRYGEMLHSVQYLFLRGLLHHFGMSEEEAAGMIEGRNYPKFEGVRSKVSEQRHLSGRYFSPERYPTLASEIRKINGLSGRELDQLAEASVALVDTIALSDSPEAGIDLYGRHTGNPFAKKFYDGMKGYREGRDEFIQDFERDVTDEVRKLLR